MRVPFPPILGALLVVGTGSGCYVGSSFEGLAPGTYTGEPDEPPDDSTSEVATSGSSGVDPQSTSGEPASSSGVVGDSSSESSTGVVASTGVVPSWDAIVADGDRLFFVGNSYTGNEGGLPIHIENAWPSASTPLHVETEAAYFWGQGLGSMFTSSVVATIESGGFDTCVVTSGTLGEMLQFVPVIDRSCGHLVVYMTWALNPTLGSMASYRDGTAAIVANMRQLEAMTDARVVPSGLVYYDLIAYPPRDDLREDWLYFPENIHQNGVGAALNVYVFYAALVSESPVGIEYELVYPWDGTVIVSGDMIASRRASDGSYLYDEIEFDDAFRTALQQRAWDVTAAWFAGTTEFD